MVAGMTDHLSDIVTGAVTPRRACACLGMRGNEAFVDFTAAVCQGLSQDYLGSMTVAKCRPFLYAIGLAQ
jgi:hypothetical protein